MTCAFSNRSNSIARSLVAILLLIPGIPRPVLAETTECTPITALPTVITEQGIYCLTGNLSTAMTSGNAVEIQTNNVTIDLNGWKLGGLAAGTDTLTNGIYADGRKNITIRNGTVRGFHDGIEFDGGLVGESQGNLIEDVRLEQNRQNGILSRGRGDVIRRNQIVDTGGSTWTSVGIAINVRGAGARVLGNDIAGVASRTVYSAYGIYQGDTGAATIIDGNRISEVESETGTSFGIHLHSTDNALVSGNHIVGPIDYGISFFWLFRKICG